MNKIEDNWLNNVLKELDLPIDGPDKTELDQAKLMYLAEINSVFEGLLLTGGAITNALDVPEKLKILKAYINGFENAWNGKKKLRVN